MACVAIFPLLGFIGLNGRQLWSDFCLLRNDQVSVRASAIVGYVDINPDPSFARSPDDWIHDEGNATLLWAGWKKGKHQWFTLGLGEIDRLRISTPMGRDVIRAIDFPLYETGGGERWVRIADDARVAGFDSSEGSFAYPLTILDKVEMINEQIGELPVVVTYTPVVDKISVYEALVDGQRVTFGHGGYFFRHHPVLYDRSTESLWSEVDEVLVAVAGRRKGTRLKRIAQLEFVAWSTWKSDHPEGKLLIGADRSKPIPEN
jgi:hypothetical protein